LPSVKMKNRSGFLQTTKKELVNGLDSSRSVVRSGVGSLV